MKKMILLGSLSVFMMNCNKKTEANSITTTKAKDTLGVKSFCYMGITGKDTVYVSIDDNSGAISGKMLSKNSRKDGSKGEISGVRSGDTLKLMYTFSAEGRESKNDLYFLQTKDALLEGIGNRDIETGTKYANDKKIKYGGGRNLKIADCNTIVKTLK